MKMRSLRFKLFAILLLLSTAAFTQSDAQKPAAQSEAPKPSAAPVLSEAQKSFAAMKSLAGEWEGPLTTSPEAPEVQGHPAHLVLRVTSRGNALMHDLTVAGIPDNPITMFYVDSDRMLLTHYCDAGNRPTMSGKMSPDGKTLEFEFIGISGNPKYHMHHAVFTLIDANHHIEDWTFMMGDKPIHAHFDLHRKS
jgi:hypothetical protein